MPATRSSALPVRPAPLLPRLLVALALAGAGAAGAQGGWQAAGSLAAGDAIYRRPYLFEGQCFLSSVGTQVYFDVYELILDSAVPSDLSGTLCNPSTGFDTVLYFYQQAGPAGPFSAGNPCANLVAYNDDACGGAQSEIVGQALAAGKTTVVLTSYGNGVTGPYLLDATSLTAQLDDFIFHSGFETGNTRTWSFVLPAAAEEGRP